MIIKTILSCGAMDQALDWKQEPCCPASSVLGQVTLPIQTSLVKQDIGATWSLWWSILCVNMTGESRYLIEQYVCVCL